MKNYVKNLCILALKTRLGPTAAYSALALAAAVSCNQPDLSGQAAVADAALNEPEPMRSLPEAERQSLAERIAERFAEPAVAAALCRLIGVSAADSSGLSCQAIEATCKVAFGAVGPGTSRQPSESPLGLAPDTQVFDDCPATATQLDSCLTELIDIAVESVSDLQCGESGSSEAIEAPTPADLLAAPNCVVIAILCPELAAALLPFAAP